MTTIDTIIFDLGGVLIDWDPRHLYRKIFEEEEDMEFFLREITTPDWNEQQDAGRSLQEATDSLVARHPEHEDLIRAYYGRWAEMLNGPIPGTVEILRQLRARQEHRLYALTNWSAETFPIAQERYDFLSWFEGILVSGQEQLKKPDPRIYQLILQRYDIRPAHSLFIDDNLRNVKAAAKMGIQAIHFRDPDRLRNDLQQHGISLDLAAR